MIGAPYSEPTTSRDAAESIVSVAQSMRALIYNTLSKSLSGLTCDELEVQLDMRHQTASARLRELELQGLVRKRATWLSRPTRTGRKARVYIAVK